MTRNLADYEIIKKERDLVRIGFDEAQRVKEIATSFFGQPGVHRVISDKGVEHHIAYATSILPDGKTSMGSNVQEFFMQSFVTPLYDGESTDESWRALVSFLSYDDRFAGDSSVRHVYDVDAVDGLVLAARHRIFSIRNAPYEGYSSARGKLVSYAFAGYNMQKSLIETAMRPQHIERLETCVQRGLARVATTSHRVMEAALHPSDARVELGDLTDGERNLDPLFYFIEPDDDKER